VEHLQPLLQLVAVGVKQEEPVLRAAVLVAEHNLLLLQRQLPVKVMQEAEVAPERLAASQTGGLVAVAVQVQLVEMVLAVAMAAQVELVQFGFHHLLQLLPAPLA
jgi:hypothetical protein